MSIARKITVSVLLFSGLFTLLGTGLQLFFDYERDVEGVEKTLSLIGKSHINSLNQSVWGFDISNVEIQLSEVMNLPDVAYVELTIPDVAVLEKGMRPAPHLQVSRQFELSFSPDAGSRSVHLGRLLVVVTLENIYQNLKDRLVVILLTQAVKVLFVAVFILFLLYMLVTRHLEKISDFIANTTISSLTKPLRLSKGGRLFGRKGTKDELSILVDSINSMRSELNAGVEAKHQNEEQLRHEINDRREAEKTLQESEAHLRTLVETLPDLIWLKNQDGVYLSCNRKFERFFGAKESDIVGNTDHDFLDKITADSFAKKDREAILAQESCWNEEEVCYADDGHMEFLETIKTPMYDAAGKLIGILGVGRDITERKQAEQNLRRTQKMDAIGQMAGGIAHDFNNILGIITGNLSLLENQIQGDEKTKKRLNTIHKSTQRATDLTKQLLGFSRRQVAQVSVTNINAIIQDMEALIVRTVTPEVEIKLHLADDLWLTEVDIGDFEDALLNLTLNARDAMGGAGVLAIETRNCTLDNIYCQQTPDAVPGDYVQLAVSDSGEGISRDQQEHIFEPFYSTKPVGKGTGLGLAMVFGFIKRSGGHIMVYSELGMRTTFKLYLPCTKEQELSAQAENESVDESPRGSETILVVDDEEGMLNLAQEFLESLGYTVLTADCGQQALELLANDSSVALLFSDVIMPGGMNGYELAEQAMILRPHLGVLLTSGYTGKVVVHEGQERFSRNLLSKPYSQSNLASRVRQLLDKSDLDG